MRLRHRCAVTGLVAQMRWSVGRKLAGLAGVGIACVVVVGGVGTAGTGSVNRDVSRVVRDNNAKSAQAEVDASHDNTQAAVLELLRGPTAEERARGAADLKDSLSGITTSLRDVRGANVSPQVNAATDG